MATLRLAATLWFGVLDFRTRARCAFAFYDKYKALVDQVSGRNVYLIGIGVLIYISEHKAWDVRFDCLFGNDSGSFQRRSASFSICK